MLDQNLRNSLDLYNRGKSETVIFFKKLTDIDLSLTQIMLAIMFIFLGILTFYIAPYSFLFGNYSLFLNIMNILLIQIILGLTIITSLFIPLFHKKIIYLFLWLQPSYKKFENIILNNMKSNQKRNNNSAITLALCLNFLIFSGCSFLIISKVGINIVQ